MSAAIAATLLIVLQDGAIGLAEYRDRLRSIQDAIERKDLEAARLGAGALKPLRIRHDGLEFQPDATVLDPVSSAKDAAAARDVLVPLRALRAELEAIETGPVPSPPDGELFERLKQEEAARQLSPDRNVEGPGLNPPEVPQSLLDKIEAFFEYIGEKIQRFFRWLFNLLFGGPRGATQAPSTRWLVAGLVVALLGILGAIAILVLRRRQKVAGVETVSEAPAMSAKDDDPLSRTASEWERFAAELMQSGRFREAIRAWYHAVLVSLFRAGALHYRKDRTNWEYAYALPSTLPWRPGFMEATRTFEREWYGRRDTPVETAEIYQEQARKMLAGVREGAAA